MRATAPLIAGTLLAIASLPAAEVHLEPILQNSSLPDGGRRMQVLFLWHLDTDADGNTVSCNILNYLRTPELTAVLPLYYQFGSEAERQTMLVPFWFQGPGYQLAPLALSGAWDRRDGGNALWITPLFHQDRDASGRISDSHLLNWYRVGDSQGVLPLWHAGPGSWALPPLLTGQWERERGGTTTWVTPLFHRSSDAEGATDSMHLLTWWHNRTRDIVFPIAWRTPEESGVLPFWVRGDGAWASPLLLSAGWNRRDGGDNTWITPLYHRSSDAGGRTTSMHLGPWWRSGEASGLFPITWHNPTRDAVIPLWFSGPDWWLAPPTLSASWDSPAGRSTWITPLYHRDPTTMHLGPWFAGQDWQTLPPLYYRQGAHSGYLPLWFQGPGYTLAPPLLSGSWTRDDGGRDTWITPLYHRSTTADGRVGSQHLLGWFENGAWSGLLPFWFGGPDTWAIPPLLTWSTSLPGGGDRTWITPLYHRDRDASGRTTGMHLLNYTQSGERQALLPIWFRDGSDNALLPVWFSGEGYRFVPPALSWWRQRSDGSDSTWITPLYHRDRDADGRTRSLHAGTWVQGEDWSGLLPLWFAGSGWWAAPAALSGSWRRSDGGSSTWVTPLAHWDRDPDGRIADLHALTYLRSGKTQAFLPLWIGGAEADIVPPLLSGHWRRDDGGSALWVTPLYHQGRDARGEVTDWHLLNWLHGRESDAVLPLWWRRGADWTAPAALSAHWHDAAGSQTWVTPLYHRSIDTSGNLRHEHVLNYVATPSWETAFPLWWDWRNDAGGRSSLLAPLWYQRRDGDGVGQTVVPPLLFAYRRGQQLDTSLEGQLWPFQVQVAQDDSEVNVLWRLYHQRTQRGYTERNLGPLWWSGGRSGRPADWQILGGLLGCETDARTGSRSTYALWFLPLGSAKPR